MSHYLHTGRFHLISLWWLSGPSFCGWLQFRMSKADWTFFACELISESFNDNIFMLNLFLWCQRSINLQIFKDGFITSIQKSLWNIRTSYNGSLMNQTLHNFWQPAEKFVKAPLRAFHHNFPLAWLTVMVSTKSLYLKSGQRASDKLAGLRRKTNTKCCQCATFSIPWRRMKLWLNAGAGFVWTLHVTVRKKTRDHMLRF